VATCRNNEPNWKREWHCRVLAHAVAQNPALSSSSKLGGGARGEAKTRFWDAVLKTAEARLDEPFLFVGDWNTGAHRLDETGKTFVCARALREVIGVGLDRCVAAPQCQHD
jgi:hypothetical protein